MTRNQRIVRAYLDGATQAELARKHGISQSRISAIISRAGKQGDWRARIGESLARHHHQRIAKQCGEAAFPRPRRQAEPHRPTVHQFSHDGECIDCG